MNVHAGEHALRFATPRCSSNCRAVPTGWCPPSSTSRRNMTCAASHPRSRAARCCSSVPRRTPWHPSITISCP